MSRISIHFAGELRCRVLTHSSPTSDGMSRHSLMEQLAIRLSPQAGKSLVMRGSLQCPRDAVGRSPLVRERGAAGLPAPDTSHRRVRPAIPQNELRGF